MIKNDFYHADKEYQGKFLKTIIYDEAKSKLNLQNHTIKHKEEIRKLPIKKKTIQNNRHGSYQKKKKKKKKGRRKDKNNLSRSKHDMHQAPFVSL